MVSGDGSQTEQAMTMTEKGVLDRGSNSSSDIVYRHLL